MTKRKAIDQLRSIILENLHSQGFQLRGSEILPPSSLNKQELRQLHATAIAAKLAKAQGGLSRFEDRLNAKLIAGRLLDPKAIDPVLVPVCAGSFEERLFRYAYLHWSIPVSTGYGRRLRYLVVDRGHDDALMGVIGLHDPIIALRARDEWIGWTPTQRLDNLHHVMDAYVLGSVPPYSHLLGGKLVALLATSFEVQEGFRQRHGDRVSLISQRALKSRLALITTSSALGRSSIYNRLTHKGREVFIRLGVTSGSGDFHFANGTYSSVLEVVRKYGRPPKDRKENWGKGYRNRREVIYAGLTLAGLPTRLRRHGVEREVFAVPLAHNTQKFLRGDAKRLDRFEAGSQQIFEAFRERWLLPRSRRNTDWKEFEPSAWRLWPK